MGTTADKLNKLLETKAAIKEAIQNKGVEVTDEDTFASYPEKINAIEAGGGGYSMVDIVNIATANGTNGYYAFYKWGVSELELNSLDTSAMTDTSYMFHYCSDLTSLNLSGLNTSNVTKMMFMFAGCKNLTTLDLSSFDTSKVTTMQSMFGQCMNMESLNLSSFNTSKVTTMSSMFADMEYLTSLDLSNFDTSKVTGLGSLFSGCKRLAYIDLSSFDLSHITNNNAANYAFRYCYELTDLYPPQNIPVNLSLSDSTKLSHESLIRVLNNLATVSSTKTLTLGATNLAKLTDEEKAIATDKGWTLK